MERAVKAGMNVLLTLFFLMIAVGAFAEMRAAAVPLGIIFLALAAYSAKQGLHRWRETA